MNKEKYIYAGTNEAYRLDRQTKSEADFLNHLITLAGIKPGQLVVDFGSGSGSVTRLIAEHVKSKGKVIGIEIDPERVKISQQKTNDMPNMSFIQGDILRPPSLTQPADVAWSNYVAAHLGEENSLLMAKNMKQAVKRGGTVAIHDITKWELRGIPEELNAQFLQIWKTAKSLNGVNAAIGTRLDDILTEAGLQNVKRYNLIHNSFTGKIPQNIIDDWSMRLSAPGIRKAAVKTLGEQKTTTLYKDFLQWMKSGNPNNHIHTETVLAIGIK